MRKHQSWKAALCSPTQAAETAEGEETAEELAKVKAVHLYLDIVEQEKWPLLYLCADSGMVANVLWRWLQ